MRKHKYKLGQMVRLVPGRRNEAVPAGTYEVTRLLPAEGAEQQYRVKSLADGHERVVKESQLG